MEPIKGQVKTKKKQIPFGNDKKWNDWQ